MSGCAVFGVTLDNVLYFPGLLDETKEIHGSMGILLLSAGGRLPEALRQEGSRRHKKEQGAHHAPVCMFCDVAKLLMFSVN